jgi:hypothetical protein
MALVYCTKCGHRVSTTAPRCPGCGEPPPVARKEDVGGLTLNTTHLRVGGALAVVVGFFMPWFTLGPVSVAGYQIWQAATGWERGLAICLYAIPALGLVTMLSELSSRTNQSEELPRRSLLAAATGGLPILGVGYLIASIIHAQNPFAALSVGAYVTLAAALVLVASIRLTKKTTLVAFIDLLLALIGGVGGHRILDALGVVGFGAIGQLLMWAVGAIALVCAFHLIKRSFGS